MKKIVCYCEESIEVDIPEEIDIDKEPSNLDSIFSGEFLNFKCPNCGKPNPSDTKKCIHCGAIFRQK